MALYRDVPPASLLLELEDVARSAEKFRDIVQSSNVNVDGFPRAELVTIAASLSRLKDGTAEGCRIPLEYARSRLPAVRREFFLPEPSTQGDAAQPFRGLHLDQSLTELIGSVTTALDEYRRLAREANDDSILDEETADPAPDSTGSVGNDALRAGATLAEAASEVRATVLDTASMKRKLQAQITDAGVVSEIAGAELRMRPIFVRWIRAIGGELKRAPRRIQQLGRAIQVGVDVAQPFAHRWSEFWSNFETFLLQELRSLGETVEKTGHTLEGRVKRNKESPNTEFSTWLIKFIEDRQHNDSGVPIIEVALGIQFQYRTRPKDFAKAQGARTLTELVEGIEGVFVAPASGGSRAVLERHRKSYERNLETTLAAFRSKFAEFKVKHPSCDTGQVTRWMRQNFPTGEVLPNLYAAPSSVLKSEGYIKVGKGKWQLPDGGDAQAS